MQEGTTEYQRLVAAAAADERVLGIILTGSRAREHGVREDSDWDVRLVVADAHQRDTAETFAFRRGSRVEAVVVGLSTLEREPAIGDREDADRYSYTHARVVVDRLDGRIGELVTRRGVLSPEVAAELAGRRLDEYINFYYRSVKNLASGLLIESRLDAAESLPPFLTWLFAAHGRVRPFNKFLVWELENHPLGERAWTAAVLVPLLDAVACNGGLPAQQQLFRCVELLARERGQGPIIDGWQPDLPLLRGTTSKPQT